MKKIERADFVRKRLAKMYPKPKPPLNFTNPFTLLIAVLLSAQCTDKKVNIVTKDLLKQAHQKMLALGEQKSSKPLSLVDWPQKIKSDHFNSKNIN